MTVEPRQLPRRLLSAAVALPVLAGVIWLGASWFSFLIALAAGFGALELSMMARVAGRRPMFLVAAGWAVCLVFGGHFRAAGFGPDYAVVVVVGGFGFFPALAWLLFRSGYRVGLSDWGLTAAIAIYTGGLLAYAPLLRGLDHGREWIFFVLAVIFAADTAAYLAGKSFGSRPMAPSISPRKTWEGAAAGLAMAIVASAASAYLLGLDIALAEAMALGAAVGIVAQLGDLAESRMKRAAGVKESGWLIPGHGGILDRLDSIVPNLLLVYYFVMWTVQ